MKISVDVVRTRDPNVLVGLVTKEIDLATVSALNKTAKNTQVEASKRIRAEMNISKKGVDSHLRIIKANRSRQAAEVRVRRTPSRLMDFKPNETKRGLTFRIKKNRPRQRLEHAFIATVKAGRKKQRSAVARFFSFSGEEDSGKTHTGVFMRRGKSRLPIDEVFTTTVLDSFQNTLDHLRSYTNERLLINLKAEAKYRLAKSFGRTRKRKAA